MILLAVGLCAVGGLITACNLVIVATRRRRRHFISLIPFVGGLAGAAGVMSLWLLALAPPWAIAVPLLLDPACAWSVGVLLLDGRRDPA
jgi:hypothetical protein